MQYSKIKKIFLRGIALALPLMVVVYFLKKVIDIFKKFITPIASRLGVEKIFGQITITIFAILILAVLIFILGLLMNLPIVSRYKNYLEEWILKIFPSLNHLKLMAEEKLNLETANTNWKPVLVFKDEQYWPAFIIDENEEWIILAQAKVPGTEPSGMVIIRKSKINYQPISMEEMHRFNSQFGKGYISLITAGSKN